jgi:hypothetical protein
VLATLAGKLTVRRKNCAPLAGKSTLNRLEHAPWCEPIPQDRARTGSDRAPPAMAGPLQDLEPYTAGRTPGLDRSYVGPWPVGVGPAGASCGSALVPPFRLVGSGSGQCGRGSASIMVTIGDLFLAAGRQRRVVAAAQAIMPWSAAEPSVPRAPRHGTARSRAR